LGSRSATDAVILTVWFFFSTVPDLKIIFASPFASVKTEDALIWPPVDLKVTLTPSIGTLLISSTEAVIVELSELSDFTDI